ncbi:hypothetical protein BGI30_10160 [Snodgrassella alvi]|nr:hypothetical protein BGI30_10160 [Snodgrassella alvi]PIT56837.1 hypothetical protein BHC59_06810 [Snodgrassella alvi]
MPIPFNTEKRPDKTGYRKIFTNNRTIKTQIYIASKSDNMHSLYTCINMYIFLYPDKWINAAFSLYFADW